MKTGGPTVVVAALGNEHHHDDAVGAVISEMADRSGDARNLGLLGDPLDLLGLWDGADLAIVIDAVSSGASPGTIQIADLTASAGDSLQPPRLPAGRRRATSSHGIDLLGVLRLARAVDQAPRRVVLVGVEGCDFSEGVGLSPGVASAVPLALCEVSRLALEAGSCA